MTWALATLDPSSVWPPLVSTASGLIGDWHGLRFRQTYLFGEPRFESQFVWNIEVEWPRPNFLGSWLIKQILQVAQSTIVQEAHSPHLKQCFDFHGYHDDKNDYQHNFHQTPFCTKTDIVSIFLTFLFFWGFWIRLATPWQQTHLTAGASPVLPLWI